MQRPSARTAARTGGRPPTRRPTASPVSTPPAPGAGRRPPRGGRVLRSLPAGNQGRRLRAAVVVLVLVVSVFSVRLLQLQGVEASAYSERADGERLTTLTLPAERGVITDAQGTVLATSVEAVNVTADQTLVKNPALTAAALAPVLDLPVKQLQKDLTGDRRFVYLAKQVTPETWAEVKALGLAGLFPEQATRRVYPAGSIGANVVGFVGAEGTGLGGMEAVYESTLAGTAGERTYQRDTEGRQIPGTSYEVAAPVAGSDVQLTIDRDIQWKAQSAVTQALQRTRAESVSAIVSDVRTGEVLAMATAPTFDASDPTAVADDDRGNRAITDVYEPGSTGKVMTIAAVLEEGTLGPEDAVTVPGQLRRPGKTFSDSSPHGTLNLTLAGVLAKSSNIGTILAAETIGGDRLYDYLKKFGIGEYSGAQLPGESAGVIPAPADWSITSFPTIAFGQGLSVNTLQATQVYATIANDGLRVEPSLVKGTVAPDGTFTAAPAPETHRVISPETAEVMRRMMESVVSEDGTAPKAAIPGYRVAGKTGTAQRVDPACGCYSGYTASFIGFAPADDPQIVVNVTLQNPTNGYYGGTVAAPVFKEIMAFALQAKQVTPTDTEPVPYRLSND